MHDLRKLVVTVGEKLGLGDAVLRRLLNHTALKGDVLHRHYVGLNDSDVLEGLVAIQDAITAMMNSNTPSRAAPRIPPQTPTAHIVAAKG